MKRILYDLIIFSLALISAGSCEKTIAFSGGEQDQMLVINSIATTDSLLSVNLSHSVFFLDDDGNYNNRGISLSGSKQPLKAYVNDGSALDFALADTLGDYVCSYRPKEGDKIRIEASVDGLKPVYVETTVPAKSSYDFVVASITLPAFSDSSYVAGGSAKCELTVHDVPGTSNFYYLRISILESICTVSPYTGEKDTAFFDIAPEIRSADVIFNKGISSGSLLDQTESKDDSQIREPVFSDALFDGSDRKIVLNLAFWAYSTPFYYMSKGYAPDNSSFSYLMTADLCSLSSDYYYYFLTRNSDSYNNYFAEPEQTYSNVKGGVGILGAIVGNPKVFIF
jgi:hypothetical protein